MPEVAALGSPRPAAPHVALRYGPGTNGECIAPFVGDDDLVGHILRPLRNTRTLDADVVFGVPLHPAGRTREAILAA